MLQLLKEVAHGGDSVRNPTVLLQEQIERAEALKQLPTYCPQYLIWCDTTAKIIRSNFDSSYETTFQGIIHPSISVLHFSLDAARPDYIDKLEGSIQLLQAIIDEHIRF